ncbi:DUF4864 domain-containing protein [Rhodalgimonas zhirmunskyi]|uniref:DUF4864 domain-containing protein n=1 Tax=Rhodalgimonas zhirmunskyi TaxID=2964767 RepID=A0AAJ1X590_9RHOB|nr:DUF4864 domain-containing protein [Rhodoalgimonas zhirmunskyi]MDQ2093919.1 DUF4864 domain-containing protein [Rhodoalgimonas zhirmunskyi]
MKQLILVVLILVGLGVKNVRAEGDTPGMQPRNAMEQAIAGQIAAFRADDFATAFAFAAPKIQGAFGDAANFGAMVRGGYSVMLNPADMQFLARRVEGGILWQRVLYRDIHGGIHIFDYEMIEGVNGWLIGAVVPVAQPKVSA